MSGKDKRVRVVLFGLAMQEARARSAPRSASGAAAERRAGGVAWWPGPVLAAMIYTYIDIYIYAYICLEYTDIHIHMYTSVHICIHACTHVCIFIYLHICV